MSYESQLIEKQVFDAVKRGNRTVSEVCSCIALSIDIVEPALNRLVSKSSVYRQEFNGKPSLYI